MNKVQDPSINLRQQAKSHRRKNTEEVKSLPKARFYRRELEPLIGAVVNIRCSSWKISKVQFERKYWNKILMRNAEVIKAPKSRNVTLPIIIQHIWTVVDGDWNERNEVNESDTLLCRGFIYEYNSKGKKNIGLQALWVRIEQ